MEELQKSITIPISEERHLVLRGANTGDLENLRNWKNGERQYFFFQGIISPEQQQAWFNSYLQRPEDFMFVVTAEGTDIGCMGIRAIDGVWDVYNVILGAKEFEGKGLMGKAFQGMLRFAAQRQPMDVTLKVIKHNPAVGWYQKQGLCITSEESDHYCMSNGNINNKEAL